MLGTKPSGHKSETIFKRAKVVAFEGSDCGLHRSLRLKRCEERQDSAGGQDGIRCSPKASGSLLKGIKSVSQVVLDAAL
ncbi:hypothetical protein APX70_01362 [Pseudomonas syringae pv. maculicola]|uniref:Uncharacterized protein n=1 Tax=Pseudomonas syringae pv. maculicola TaxID=59511 RepID=A0A3M2VSA3_PSEYM|nr:hypothetical protein APX70_01362 [Pseudomonas syringae pv. maculicola]